MYVSILPLSTFYRTVQMQFTAVEHEEGSSTIRSDGSCTAAICLPIKEAEKLLEQLTQRVAELRKQLESDESKRACQESFKESTKATNQGTGSQVSP